MTNETQNCTPPFPQRVVSDRIIIRPTARADAPYLREWWNNPAIMGPSGHADGMQYDEADVEAWFHRHVDGREVAKHFVICLRDAQETPVGEFYIACDDRPGSVTFSIVIGNTDLWGQGYASESIRAYADALFECDCCGVMRLDVPVANERAMRMAESVGFEVEHVWANGKKNTMILTRDALALHRASAEAHS